MRLTIDQYRSKYNLPGTYPMVAPDYAKTRSSLAKEMGLGKSRSRGAQEGRTPEITRLRSTVPHGAGCGQRPLNGRGLRFSLNASAASWKSSVRYSRIGACWCAASRTT